MSAHVITRNPRSVATNEVRLSFVHLLEPFAFEETQEKKYSVTLLIDKNDTETLNAIKTAIANTEEYGKTKWHNRVPNDLRLPLYDGDDKADRHAEYKNCYYINAKSDAAHPPIVMDKDKSIINMARSAELYSGCYAEVILEFYPYSYQGMSNGISCSIRAVVKTKDGDPLGGSGSSYTPTDVSAEFGLIDDDNNVADKIDSLLPDRV